MSDSAQITGRQISAARTLLGIGQDSLAKAARISVATLRRMEASEGAVSGMPNNIDAVQRTLEAAGIIFLADGQSIDGGPGVRLKKD
jgi:transcriptional regulator with XRE-family HTH domain